MPELTVAKLPDADEVVRRLTSVIDESNAVERFYPLIAEKMADRDQTGMGIVMGLHLAASDYTRDLPPVMMDVVLQAFHLYVHALLDDNDPEVLADALAALERLGLPSD
jgi:hypothetical protein